MSKPVFDTLTLSFVGVCLEVLQLGHVGIFADDSIVFLDYQLCFCPVDPLQVNLSVLLA